MSQNIKDYIKVSEVPHLLTNMPIVHWESDSIQREQFLLLHPSSHHFCSRLHPKETQFHKEFTLHPYSRLGWNLHLYGYLLSSNHLG